MVSFRDLGLSSYEEKVYRALLSVGTATAEDLSEESDVPIGRIYDVLNGLESRDLVHCNQEAHPRVYTPVDSDTAIDRLLRDRKQDIEVERTRYENVAAELRSQVGSQPPVDGRFWETKTRDTEAEFIHSQIERFSAATDEILIVGNSILVDQFLNAEDAVQKWIESVQNNTIRIQILLSEDLADNEEQLFKLLNGSEKIAMSVETRMHPSVTANFDLIDQDELYLYVTDPFAHPGPLGTVCIYESDFIEDLKSEFTKYWREAKKT